MTKHKTGTREEWLAARLELLSRSVLTKTESPASLDQLAKSSRPPAVKFAPANR